MAGARNAATRTQLHLLLISGPAALAKEDQATHKAATPRALLPGLCRLAPSLHLSLCTTPCHRLGGGQQLSHLAWEWSAHASIFFN